MYAFSEHPHNATVASIREQSKNHDAFVLAATAATAATAAGRQRTTEQTILGERSVTTMRTALLVAQSANSWCIRSMARTTTVTRTRYWQQHSTCVRPSTYMIDQSEDTCKPSPPRRPSSFAFTPCANRIQFSLVQSHRI